MSEEIQKIGFGFVDDTSEDLQSKSGGKFGLNTGAFLTKFELNEKAGKDGAQGEALDVTIQIGDRDFNTRIYPTTKVFDKKGNEITDTSSVEYRKAYNEDWKQKNAVIVHILKSVTTEDAIKRAFGVQINSFKEFIQIAQGLIPANVKSLPLDVFLEYQWQASSGQDRTFLQLPRNMKGGYWVIPMQNPVGGTWKEVRDDKGLHYVDAQGNVHPFKRDTNFMESNKAKQQIEGEEASDAALGAAAGTGGAKKAEW